MAGIIIWEKKEHINIEKINIIFDSLDYQKGFYKENNKWNICIFPKPYYNIKNWLVSDNYFICCTGTFTYKNHFYDYALKYIANDVINNRLDIEDFQGIFIILVCYNDNILFIRDGGGLAKLYTNDDYSIISSSYASLLELCKKEYELDYMPIYELLNTGCIAGDYTITKGIRLINAKNQILKNGMEIIVTKSKDYEQPKNYYEAIELQNYINVKYINNLNIAWEEHFEDGIFDIGLTGGLDSRYLTAVLMAVTDNFVFYTHWRKACSENKDYKYALGLAKYLGKEIHIKEEMDPLDMDEDALKLNFELSYKLSDGVIRPGCYWDESYNTFKYRSNITRRPYLRLTGYGGEQYRNMECLSANLKRSMKSWVYWDMIYKFAGAYISTYLKYILIPYIANKVIKEINENYLNIFTYKKYNQKIVSVSYRSIQAIIDNRIGFALSPFLDIQLSQPSFLIIPYLNNAFQFQLDMLNRLSTYLSKYPNSYGFDFSKGEPITRKIITNFWKLSPPQFKYPLFNLFFSSHNSTYINELASKNIFAKQLDNYAFKILKEMNYKNYKKVHSRSKMALNLSYFILRNKNIINI